MASELATRSPAFVDGKSQSAQELRLNVLSSAGGATALASRGGVRPSGGSPGLVAALATPVMKVRVNAGIADIPSTSSSGGFYRVSWDQVDLDIDVSSAQARTDLIIVEVVDTGTSAATGKVRVLKGTSGAGRPTNGIANAHWQSIGAVAVRVGAESGGNIRTQDVTPEAKYAVAPGAPVPVASATERNAMAGFEGLQVFRLDTGVYETYWSGAWRSSVPDTPWVSLAAAPTTYNAPAGAAWADLPNLTGSITAPAGRTVDVELRVPKLRIEVSSSVLLRLLLGGNPVDGIDGAVGTTAIEFPGYWLRGSFVSAGAAVAVAAQIKGTGSGGYVRGTENVGPFIRYQVS